MSAPLSLAQAAALRDAARAPLPARTAHNPSAVAALRRRGLLETRHGRVSWITSEGRAALDAAMAAYRRALA